MKSLLGLVMLVSFLATAGSVFAATQAKEVAALVKCHEGKFDAMNAVSQLTSEISGERNAVYGWSGIGAIGNQVEGELVRVSKPFTVSAVTFVNVGEVTWACVTVQKK